MKPFRYRRALGLVALIALSPFGRAAAAPLSPAELEAVRTEIRAMVATDINRVPEFPVRAVTPERLARLLDMPEFAQMPRNMRENALIFAGKGGILHFDKPSDVLHRLESWFPAEFQAVRRLPPRDSRFFALLTVYGPFEAWDDEAAAFVGLWNCTATAAWVRPAQSPFRRSRDDGGNIAMTPAARSSAAEESDFGYCLAHNNGLRPGWTDAEARANAEEVRRIAARITPLLQAKFAAFLKRERCRGTGPDDCVLVLRAWSELSPADPALATALRDLEADVAPDAPLPPLSRSSASETDLSNDPGEESRFDTLLQQAAYLRARLTSLLAAPAAWPSEEAIGLMRRLAALNERAAETQERRWSHDDLDYANSALNPWALLTADVTARPDIRAAVLAVTDTLPLDPQCQAFKPWFPESAPDLRGEAALRRALNGMPARCLAPDWDRLAEGKEPAARTLRGAWLAVLPQLGGDWRDEALTALAGDACFSRKRAVPPPWRQTLCRDYISEPQTVGSARRGRPHPQAAERYRATPAPALPDNADDLQREHWIVALAAPDDREQQEALRDVAVRLRQEGTTVYAARSWRPRNGNGALLELAASGNRSRQLVLLTPGRAQPVGIPDRFRYQYDDGDITAVSDMDHDGRPEVWLSGTWGECDGEGLRPGIDCAVESVYLGEIRDGTLSWFHRDTPSRKATGGFAVDR